MKKEKKSERIYNLQLTERQVRILSYACDYMFRIICGQDWTYQEMMEAAWERRCKEATGKGMDEEWDGGWTKMREDAEAVCKDIKKRFWGLDANALYGVKYDDTSDILYDLHCVLRHRLWLDGDREFHGVDSDKPMFTYGSEPLAEITRIDNK